MASNEDLSTTRRDYKSPYGPKHSVPTVQKYREQKERQREQEDSMTLRDGADDGDGHQVTAAGSHASDVQTESPKDTSQVPQGASDPKERRKQMKHADRSRVEREVTDPVTHLPIKIRDYNGDDLEELDENSGRQDPHGGQEIPQSPISRTGTGLSGRSSRFQESERILNEEHAAMEAVFPPPNYDRIKSHLSEVYGQAMGIGLVAITSICLIALVLPATISDSTHKQRSFFTSRWFALLAGSAVSAGLVFTVVTGLQGWVKSRVKAICDDGVWETHRITSPKRENSKEPETTVWLNRLLGSIWPLMNPDMFNSVADMLEDVMQASLPSLVRMVSVEDIGQGSESIRILGIKWLPKGAAGRTVDSDGKVESNQQQDEKSKQKETSGRDDSVKDAQGRSTKAEDKTDNGKDAGVAAGMEAEEGDFVNLEMALAYRATRGTKKFRDRAKNAHLYMGFYLPGNIKVPVWVELRGFVCSVRMRLQLSPDPPFIGLCTITFLGQPKVELSCVPLVKKGINILDLPLISNFVQSAVDAAMAEYVAPKSLNLDLRNMLVGEDFKKDTVARGVIMVHIKHAFDFKEGDASIPILRKGSSDPYVSVGWAKFGKPLFSTRVIVGEMEPYWSEQTYLLVGPTELDAEESLRLQLWDSDKMSADDDLGRIEVDLKELMKSKETSGRMRDRVDAFQALKAGERMPGKLEWSLGYFTKTKLSDEQVKRHKKDPNVNSVAELKERSYRESEKKLRESSHDESAEVQQLKQQDFEETSIDMIADSPPVENFPSGILSIQIHQIVGLEVGELSKTRDADGGEPDEAEEEDGDRLPDSYCTIVLNHNKIFKTRTKPKNSKPFFNASTERFIRDWRSTSLMISVRDARVHEDDPLLGIVNIPLAATFRERGTSRLNEFFPLTGGIGYGRVRVSLVFRSVQLDAPKAALGWDWGTIEIAPEVTCSSDLPADLRKHRLKFSTTVSHGRMHATTYGGGDGKWATRKGRPMRLPVRQRYASPLMIEFRQNVTLFKDKTPAYAVLWMHDIPDEEDIDLELPVYRGDVQRAEKNVLPVDKCGDKVGSIKIKLHFWRGLGWFHAGLARRSPDVGDVLEVLQCARDNGEINCIVGDDEWFSKRNESTDLDDEDSSDSSDNDGEGHPSKGRIDPKNKEDAPNSPDGKKEGSNSWKDEIRGYKEHKDQLHRRNRGVMQFKGPRTLKWMKHKVEGVMDKVEDTFHHHDRKPDIETEV